MLAHGSENADPGQRPPLTVSHHGRGVVCVWPPPSSYKATRIQAWELTLETLPTNPSHLPKAPPLNSIVRVSFYLLVPLT
jgi:hypothetical protein